MQYEIRFAETVEEDLKKVKVFYTQKILDEIREQLTHEPDKKTTRRKILEGLIPPWAGCHSATLPHFEFLDNNQTCVVQESVIHMRFCMSLTAL